MEFFTELKPAVATTRELQQRLNFENITNLCGEIYTLKNNANKRANIDCLWGEFEISREEIRCGVRFALLNCPHALSWTITTPETGDRTIIHCTIDKQSISQEFIDSVDRFLKAWADGLA